WENADDWPCSARVRAAAVKYSLPTPRWALAALRQRRGATARKNLDAEVERLLEELRYVDAIDAVKRYQKSWGKADWIERVREEQTKQVEQRFADAKVLVQEGRYVAAREAVLIPPERFEAEAVEKNKEYRHAVEKLIRIHQYSGAERIPTMDGDPPPPPKAGRPSPPPALPGAPHADVKRLYEARALMVKASALFRSGQFGQLATAAEELVGYFGDLDYVSRRADGIQAMLTYARYKSQGLKGLFHATEVKKQGSGVKLTYHFEKPEEMLDWEPMKPIPHAQNGEFVQARRGVRGTGVAGYVLYGFFDGNVQMSCISKPQKPQSHGIGFFEAGKETRQVMLLATNHWFVEGENYVKKRPGHSILLIGKGVNVDVAVDSPEIGFVFKGASITNPDPPAGAEIKLKLQMEGDQVEGQVGYRGKTGTLKRQAKGDDGRGFQRHRPALYVIETGVIFREVVIRGRLHPSFVREREGELLDLIESALVSPE
ncbi:MAG: hypothetical protein AAGD14_19940, partial [Planctomycetota bacterium]